MSVRRLTLVGTTALALGLGALGPAGAAYAAGGDHTQTQTQTFHGVQAFSDVYPCTGDPVVGSQVSNMVMHETWFPGGDELWFTFTEEDRTTAVDPATGVTYSAHDAVWGNQNINERNGNQTFTFSLRIVGSDGSVVTGHEVAHVATDANGAVTVTFDKATMDGC
jgi:hypothetical protein